MTIEDVQTICKKLDKVTSDIKWGHDLCFNVGGKMFFVADVDNVPTSASFKTDEETFNELIEREGFKPAPYLARHKWVYVDDINRVSKKEWQHFISQSYEIVKAKLPKNKK
jgi:predicted DNA-binding protein (MmcQ/YjbR family)